ncbi:MAG: branched-chain amino acid ABC transporter permease [Nitrospirota bacterium]
MNYIFHILVMINIYIILSLSLNLLVGYTGLLSLAHAAFYGIGAYISTLLIMKIGLNFFLSLPIAIIFSAVISLSISYPSLRLKGDYFILASLAFQIIIFTILYNWIDVTRGPYGIPGIPRPHISGLTIDTLPAYFILSTLLAIIIVGIFRTVYNSPFGRVLKAIREDELSAISLGKNVFWFKVIAFAISSGIAAIAGGLYAGYITYIDPTSFTLDESIFILSVVLVGGSGNFRGPIIGAILMILLPEALRFLGIPDSIAPNLRQIIYAMTLILLMRYRPQGLAGEYKFE